MTTKSAATRQSARVKLKIECVWECRCIHSLSQSVSQSVLIVLTGRRTCIITIIHSCSCFSIFHSFTSTMTLPVFSRFSFNGTSNELHAMVDVASMRLFPVSSYHLFTFLNDSEAGIASELLRNITLSVPFPLIFCPQFHFHANEAA